MTLKQNFPKFMGTWEDEKGIVHSCFVWETHDAGRVLWSTVCMLRDSLELFAIDDAGYATPTCVYCTAGKLRWET